MKPSHAFFHIPCQEIPLSINDAQHMLKLLHQYLHPPHLWALLKTEQGVVLLATHKILTFSSRQLNLHGNRHLKTPVSACKAAQILLRLSENQKDFNQKMHRVLNLLPMTKGQFCSYLLSELKEYDANQVSDIIDQEYAKISLDEKTLKDLLAFHSIDIFGEQAKGFMHDALLSLGTQGYLPHHLASLLHHLLLDHHLCALPTELLEYGLCLLMKHPHTVVLGQFKEETQDGSLKQLAIRYHFCLKKLVYYFIVGHACLPICPTHLMNAHLLLPKT